MKIKSTTTKEKIGGDESICTEFSVGKKTVGQIELFLYADEDCEEREWLLKFKRGGDEEDGDWEILAQGHITNKK